MLYLERLHFPLILGNNKWKLACLALRGPTLPLGVFSREIADGKIKVQGKKRVSREVEAREGLFRCWLLTYRQTQTVWLEALLRGPNVFEFFPAQTLESLKASWF